ncbi:hypothetical protein V6N11_072270 [Hibiscus sabdariffa]|uniref:Uncharacterized protein n=1 Tax=Hibiscus sabdariffa TaxID=183260 RepID=A0ABR2U2K2_9ROSI
MVCCCERTLVQGNGLSESLAHRPEFLVNCIVDEILTVKLGNSRSRKKLGEGNSRIKEYAKGKKQENTDEVKAMKRPWGVPKLLAEIDSFVHGGEYAFGAHDYPTNDVFVVKP